MIFDTLAAMADWSNNRKFDDNATVVQVGTVVDELSGASSNRDTISPITTGTLDVAADTDCRTKIFAWGMQSKLPLSVVEQLADVCSSGGGGSLFVITEDSEIILTEEGLYLITE